MSRKITFLTLFLGLMTVTFPIIAQQKADTTYEVHPKYWTD